MTSRFKDLTRYHALALDTETTGLNWPRDEMFGFSVATRDWAEYYDIRREPESLDWIRDQIRQFNGTFVFFNASFDVKMFHSKEVYIPHGRIEDTSIIASLIDEQLGHGQYTLDALCKRYLGAEKESEIYEELAKLFGGLATRNVQMPRLYKAPPELVGSYAIKDARLTYDLWDWQNGEIERQGLQDIVAFEHDVMPYVLDQEIRGLRVDEDLAYRAMEELSKEVNKEQSKLDKLVGGTLNVNSTPQIRNHYDPQEGQDGVWRLADGTKVPKTPKGNPSIGNETLQAIKDKDPVADQIIKIRSIIRTRDTFLAKHICGSAVNGRVYPNINQVASEEGGTKTGRFSYTSPALQQIPNRNKEVAAIVKPCFLPDEGDVWLDSDLSSFEVRIFAHLVGRYNNSIVQQYERDPNTDFHQFVADLMGVPRNPQVGGGANAKQLNLSMIFNSGKGSIAKQLGFSTYPASFTAADGKVVNYDKPSFEAMAVIDQYHARVQGVETLANAAKEVAIKRGFLKTLYGRRLRFNSKALKSKAYKASGLLIQATSADLNKDNWRRINDALGDRGRLLLNTHDSYSMSVRQGVNIKDVWNDVKSAVENRDDLRVPLILDYNGVGPTWWDAIKKG